MEKSHGKKASRTGQYRFYGINEIINEGKLKLSKYV